MTPEKRPSRARPLLALLGVLALGLAVALVKFGWPFTASAASEPVAAQGNVSKPIDVEDEPEKDFDSRSLDKQLDDLEREIATGDGATRDH